MCNPNLPQDVFEGIVERDFFKLICGNKLGEGISREVYECAFDPTLVVKMENRAGSFCNVEEWELWISARGCYQEHWLSPCVDISPSGIFLLQKKTRRISQKELPKFIPVWLTDAHEDNWGWLDGRIVCHDYGYNKSREVGISKKVKRNTMFDFIT